MRLTILNSAKEDIKGIYRFSVADFGEKKADSYHDGLNDKLDNIANGFVAFTKYDNIKNGLRRTNYESHAIFYQISNDTVVILRVLHQSMNPVKHID